jgi:hypothetical protein
MAYYPISTEISGVYTLSGGGWRAVFNDQNDFDYVGPLTDVTGLDAADMRESAGDLVEADGGIHGAFYLSRRPITLSGRIINHATMLERRTKLDKARNASLALRSDASLIWKPSARQDNYVPNPSFEVDVTSGFLSTSAQPFFVNPGATVTRVTAQHNVGAAAAQMVTTAASASQGFTETLGVLPPGTYNASLYVKGNAGGEAVRLYAGHATGAATFALLTANTSWQRVSTTFVSDGVNPSYIALNTQVAAAVTVFVDNLQVTPGATLLSYFDGDTAGYYWMGNAHQTRSGDYVELYVPVRRQQPFRESGAAWVKEFQISLVSQYATIFSSSLKTASAPAGTGVVVENRGNYPAYPLVQIAGAPSGANTIVTDGHGGTFRTLSSLTIASGEIAEFDMLNHTGRFTAGARNGQSATRYIDFQNITQWPSLITGNNTFTLAAGAAGTLTLAYRDVWA